VCVSECWFLLCVGVFHNFITSPPAQQQGRENNRRSCENTIGCVQVCGVLCADSNQFKTPTTCHQHRIVF
jgi:hypothetical protein